MIFNVTYYSELHCAIILLLWISFLYHMSRTLKHCTVYDIQRHLLFGVTLCYNFVTMDFIFYQQKSNWLFGKYITLTYLLYKILH